LFNFPSTLCTSPGNLHNSPPPLHKSPRPLHKSPRLLHKSARPLFRAPRPLHRNARRLRWSFHPHRNNPAQGASVSPKSEGVDGGRRAERRSRRPCP
jgi:hypothetical protein